MEVTGHVQRTQNSNLVIFFQLLQENVSQLLLYFTVMQKIQMFYRGKTVFVVSCFSEIQKLLTRQDFINTVLFLGEIFVEFQFFRKSYFCWFANILEIFKLFISQNYIHHFSAFSSLFLFVRIKKDWKGNSNEQKKLIRNAMKNKKKIIYILIILCIYYPLPMLQLGMSSPRERVGGNQTSRRFTTRLGG